MLGAAIRAGVQPYGTVLSLVWCHRNSAKAMLAGCSWWAGGKQRKSLMEKKQRERDIPALLHLSPSNWEGWSGKLMDRCNCAARTCSARCCHSTTLLPLELLLGKQSVCKTLVFPNWEQTPCITKKECSPKLFTSLVGAVTAHLQSASARGLFFFSFFLFLPRYPANA